MMSRIILNVPQVAPGLSAPWEQKLRMHRRYKIAVKPVGTRHDTCSRLCQRACPDLQHSLQLTPCKQCTHGRLTIRMRCTQLITPSHAEPHHCSWTFSGHRQLRTYKVRMTCLLAHPCPPGSLMLQLHTPTVSNGQTPCLVASRFPRASQHP